MASPYVTAPTLAPPFIHFKEFNKIANACGHGIVAILYCDTCSQHGDFTLDHQEYKYAHYCREVARVVGEFPSFEVIKRGISTLCDNMCHPTPSGGAVLHERGKTCKKSFHKHDFERCMRNIADPPPLGAFEVTVYISDVRGDKQRKSLHSKIASKRWPRMPELRSQLEAADQTMRNPEKRQGGAGWGAQAFGDQNRQQPITRQTHPAQQLEKGEVLVTIQHCDHCNVHATSTRHEEGLYLSKAEQVESEILGSFPSVTVTKLGVYDYDNFYCTVQGDHRFHHATCAKRFSTDAVPIGIFDIDVYHRSAGGSVTHVNLSSKIRTGKWPSVSNVIRSLGSFLDECDKSHQRIPEQGLTSPQALAGVEAKKLSSWSPPPSSWPMDKIMEASRYGIERFTTRGA